MVRVFLPSGLRRLAGGKGELAASGETVREIIDDLERQFPGLRDRLYDGDRLRPGMSVVVGSTIGNQGLLQPVPPAGFCGKICVEWPGRTGEVH